MVAHNCKHEKEIGKYFEMIERHEHVLMDNGQPGVVTVVTELKHSVDNLVTLFQQRDKKDQERDEDVKAIKTTMSAIVQANNDLQKWQEECINKKEKEEKDKKESEIKKDQDNKYEADYKLRKRNVTLYLIFIVMTAINIALIHLLK